MKNKDQSLQSKIFNQKIYEKSSAEIVAFKQAHRKQYTQQKNKEYQKKQKRKTLIFTLEEFEHLQNEAQKYQKQLSPFLKNCIFAYLQQQFILPDDTQIKQIEQSIRDANNRLNETLRYIHQHQQINVHDIQVLKNTIQQVETKLSLHLRQPIKLEDWLKRERHTSAEFIPKLLRKLSEVMGREEN